MEAALLILAIACAAAAAYFFKLYSDSRALAASADAKALAAEAQASELRSRLDETTSQLSASREAKVEAETRLAETGRRLQALDSEHTALMKALDDARSALSAAKEENSALSMQLEMLEKRFEEMQKAAEDRFRNIAAEILDRNSSTFGKQNSERLSEILSPLNQQIQDFKKRVEEIYSDESREIFSLKDRLKDLRDLGETMSRDAKELSGALRGNNGIQGDWGEMVLESILERSGLRRDFEYKVQVTRDESGALLTDADGNQLRPDVVVYYPDNRCVVIDSKSSMTAYLRYNDATDEASRAAAGSEHVASVRRHLDKLAAKHYEDLLGDRSLDFIMMFIPSEAAYIAAMRLSPTLWQDAFKRRVLIVSPSLLVSALKIVEQLWRREQQNANVAKIAEEAGKMYDKFAAFVEDLRKIGANLDTVRNSYDNAMKKLTSGKGNLVKKAESLRQLGIKASKNLPPEIIRLMEESDDNEPDQLT